MTRAIEIVRAAAKRARAEYLAAFEHGDALLVQHGITTPLRLAHFLAQALHETGGLTIAWESGNYRAARILEIFGVGHHSAAVTPAEAEKLAGDGPALFERVYGLGNPKKARELGNTEPGDGWKYRGGGILQTTGRGNYRRMGQKCGVDFEGHPDWVTSAEYALVPALTEWSEGNLNAAADADDIRSITRKINGGFNGLADRQNWLAVLKPLCAAYAPGAPQPAPETPPAEDQEPEVPPSAPPPPGIESPQALASTEKSPTEQGGFLAKARNWLATISGFSFIGYLTDWQIAAILFGFLLLLVVMGTAFALWLFGKDSVRDFIRRHVV